MPGTDIPILTIIMHSGSSSLCIKLHCKLICHSDVIEPVGGSSSLFLDSVCSFMHRQQPATIIGEHYGVRYYDEGANCQLSSRNSFLVLTV